MKNLFKILTVMLFCGFLPVGCADNCGGDETKSHVKTMEVQTLDLHSRFIDSSMVNPYDSSFIKLSVDEIVYTRNENKNNGFTGNVAFACDPVAPMLVEKLENIKIVAVSDIVFQKGVDSVKAGDDISDRFVVGLNSGYQLQPVKDFFKQSWQLHQFDSFWLRLQNKPVAPVLLHFNVIAKLNNGVIELKDYTFYVN